MKCKNCFEDPCICNSSSNNSKKDIIEAFLTIYGKKCTDVIVDIYCEKLLPYSIEIIKKSIEKWESKKINSYQKFMSPFQWKNVCENINNSSNHSSKLQTKLEDKHNQESKILEKKYQVEAEKLGMNKKEFIQMKLSKLIGKLTLSSKKN